VVLPSHNSLGNGQEGLQAKVEAVIARTSAEAHAAAYQQPEGFKAVEPVADDPLRTTHALDTRSVARGLPIVLGRLTAAPRGAAGGRPPAPRGGTLVVVALGAPGAELPVGSGRGDAPAAPGVGLAQVLDGDGAPPGFEFRRGG
jgi:hypothetical protein